ARHAGHFVGFLESVGVWDPAGLVRDWEEVLATNADTPRALYAHGNYLPAGQALPANATVVYCPRTHDFFRHGPHPFRELLARGVSVALGTDSLASNPDLSVLREVRFLHERFPDIPGETLLRMATIAGAEALGWGSEFGSLEPGTR